MDEDEDDNLQLHGSEEKILCEELKRCKLSREDTLEVRTAIFSRRTNDSLL
ncbi:hypothetical protein SDJN02_05484 [Cucurbita argyrosperma subsp. argyrosperma]|nr:hypothetical protein SDJN02_05484 [Cucurbita argyrosperma subsp. argyrosperma]